MLQCERMSARAGRTDHSDGDVILETGEPCRAAVGASTKATAEVRWPATPRQSGAQVGVPARVARRHIKAVAPLDRTTVVTNSL